MDPLDQHATACILKHLSHSDLLSYACTCRTVMQLATPLLRRLDAAADAHAARHVLLHCGCSECEDPFFPALRCVASWLSFHRLLRSPVCMEKCMRAIAASGPTGASSAAARGGREERQQLSAALCRHAAEAIARIDKIKQRGRAGDAAAVVDALCVFLTDGLADACVHKRIVRLELHPEERFLARAQGSVYGCQMPLWRQARTGVGGLEFSGRSEMTSLLENSAKQCRWRLCIIILDVFRDLQPADGLDW